MRVLITGGTGFIGSQVARAASARGHDVTLLGRRQVSSELPLITHDLVQAAGLGDRLKGFDVVVHCAAAMSGTADEQRAATVQGTQTLVNAMRAARVRRMILVSSFAVYDYETLATGAVLTEESPIDRLGGARGPYVAAKCEQEEIVRADRDIEWTIIRPGLVFGPGRTWFYQLGMQLPGIWVMLAGDGQLPLTHVENCAEAIVAAVDTPAALQAVINVVDDKLPTRADYVNWLASHQSRVPRVVDIPWGALHTASRTAWAATHGVLRDLIMPPGSLHPAVLAARCKPLRYDNARAHALLGWSPRVGVREGVRAAFERR